MEEKMQEIRDMFPSELFKIEVDLGLTVEMKARLAHGHENKQDQPLAPKIFCFPLRLPQHTQTTFCLPESSVIAYPKAHIQDLSSTSASFLTCHGKQTRASTLTRIKGYATAFERADRDTQVESLCFFSISPG